MHTHIHTHAHTHMHTHIHTHARAHTHTHAHTHAQTNTRTHTHTQAHVHMHTRMRKHTHTRAHTTYNFNSCIIIKGAFCVTIFLLIQENADLSTVAYNAIIPHPCVLIRGSMSDPKDAFLVIEKSIICKITNCKWIPLLLLASYYIFNIHYPTGLVNFYTFMECIILQFKPSKDRTRINN